MSNNYVYGKNPDLLFEKDYLGGITNNLNLGLV